MTATWVRERCKNCASLAQFLQAPDGANEEDARVRMNDGGGGGSGTVVVNAEELRGLASTARRERTDLDGVARSVGGLMGGLDRRGWNAGAADSAWSSARGILQGLAGALDAQAQSLDWLAGLVDQFESGQFCGGVPLGIPMQDPVNSYTGNLSHQEVDLLLPARGKIPLALVRTYNSRDGHRGIFGPGWTCSLEKRVDSIGDDLVLVARGDGRRDLYVRRPDGSYARPTGVRADLSREPGGTWRLTTPDGRWFTFSARGVLDCLGDSNANVLTVEYDRNGRPTSFRDGVGRALTLTYLPSGLAASLTNPIGRTVNYRYTDEGCLETVSDAIGTTMRYRYDARDRLVQVVDGREVPILATTYDADGRVRTQTDPIGGVSQFEYDGPTTTLTDPRGGKVTIFHDERGLVASVTDALGFASAFTYTDCGNRETMRDKAGGMWRFEYDGDCRLVRVEDPAGGVQTNTYDSAGNIVAYTDAAGGTWRYVYDDLRNVIAAIDPEGATTSVEVDENGQIVRRTDADGVITTYTYNDAGLVTTVGTARGEERRAYDAQGRLIARSDPNKSTQRWIYDGRDRPIQRVAADGVVTAEYDRVGNLTSFTAPDGAMTHYSYDAANRIVRVLDPLGRESSYSYDANNNLTDVIDPAGYSVHFGFDALDRPLEFTDSRGNRWRRDYDPNGELVSGTDGRGGTLRWSRDGRGRVVAATDRTGATTRYTYDLAGRVTSVMDPSGTVTRYQYDTAGRPVLREDALGHRSELRYTPAGRLAEQIDPLGRHYRFAYDAVGRLARVEDPLGGTMTYEYDAAGRLIRQTDRAGRSMEFAYDAANRLVQRIDPGGSVTRWQYDAAGQVVEVTDPENRQLHFSYDLAGHLTTVTDPLHQTTRYVYDARGFLLERQDALARTTRYAYDPNGWFAGTTDALGRSTRYALDANGNWIERIDPDGTRSTAIYDAENRPIEIASPDGTFIRLEYDAAGRPSRMLDSLGATTFAYDALGRLLELTDPFEQRVRYTYDGVGRRSALQYPDGTSVAYRYDDLDRLLEVAGHRYLYDEAAQPVGLELPGGGGWHAQRDIAGRIIDVRYLDPSESVVAQFGYTYDATGNVTSAVEDGRETRYAYDSLNRLIAAGDHRYRYDAVGNRLEPGVPLIHTLARASVCIKKFDAADQLESHAYDARGNPLQGAHGERFAWDAAGRLTSVDCPDGSNVRYAYYGLGNLRERTWRDAAGAESTQRLVVDLVAPLPQVIAKIDDSGTANYVYGLGRIGDTESAFIDDIRGSLRGTLSSDSSSRRDYDPWGVSSSRSPSPKPFGFTGEIEEPDPGLVHLRARWYQPATGRMLGRDPLPGDIFDPLSQHPYAYAHDNPVSAVDPSGLSASSVVPPGIASPLGPFNALYPFDLMCPPGALPGSPGEVPTAAGGHQFPGFWPWFTSTASLPADYLAEYAHQQVKIIDGLFANAKTSFAQAAEYYQSGKTALLKALTPAESWVGRLPFVRDFRQGWFEGEAQHWFDRSLNASNTGKYLQDTAQAMDDAKPWLRPVAKVVPFASAVVDFGLTAYTSYQDGAGEPQGVRIRHAVIDGGFEAAGSVAGGVGAAAACSSTVIGAVIAPGCAVAGSFVGGKIGGYAGKGVNWAVDEISSLF